VFKSVFPTQARIPAKLLKNIGPIIEANAHQWALLDRFMTPRTPQKADDRVVLAILGGAFGAVACLSAVLLATRFSL